jgi:LPXTG-motif cell wall-anchored protein
MTSKRVGLLAVVAAAAMIWAIPAASAGKTVDLRKTGEALRDVTAGVGAAVDKTLAKTDAALRKTRDKAAAAVDKTSKKRADTRATATDPAKQPPMHGANPHAQGGVAVVDLNPSNERPLGSKPDGTDSGEDVILGRARGEKTGGAYHGHITILALLGQEVAGVDTAAGETKAGPLDAIQTGILDPLCASTSQQVCLSVLTADSKTTAQGSDNDFALARASVLGLGVGAAESHGTIADTSATCQEAQGASRVANVSAPGGGAVANVSDATTNSKSCTGQAPVVTNTSHVIGLAGAQVPLPAAGCADGTPDTVTGIPGVLPIVCNAEDIAGAAAVREALDVFVLQVGSTSLTKATTASSEAISEAPPAAAAETGGPQCSDTIDNDGDGVIDAADPGCHSDNDASNNASYNPNDDDETDKKSNTGGSSKETGVECADKKDNDGDGLVDAKDPGCHTDGDASNPNSYDATDDSEAGGGGGGGNGAGAAPTGGQSSDNGGTLPFTGTDVVGLALAGLLMLAGGLLLRRREDSHPAL